MRKYAVREAKANLNSCFSNLRAQNIRRFSSPFKTKKAETQNGWSWTLEKANVTRGVEEEEKKRRKGAKKKDKKTTDKLYIFKDLLGEMKYNSTKQFRKLMPDMNPCKDPKLQRDKYGDYYLVFEPRV